MIRYGSGGNRPEIGYVPQSGRFDPIFPLTVLDVVEMGGYPSSGKQIRAVAIEVEGVPMLAITARFGHDVDEAR